MKKIVVIIGNIGAGKSTAVSILRKHIDASILDADTLFQTTDPFREQFLKDMSRWAFCNELWLTLERYKLTKKHLAKNSKRYTIIDSGLLMSWVYMRSHLLEKKITPAEWSLYEEMYQHLTREVTSAMVIIDLDYATKTLLYRIKKRGRGYELKYYTEKYFKQLELGLKSLREKLKKEKVPIITISEKKSADFEHNKKDREVLINTVKKGLAKL